MADADGDVPSALRAPRRLPVHTPRMSWNVEKRILSIKVTLVG